MDAQVAVQAHLRGCPACLAERRRLAEVGTLLRASVAARVPEERGRIERHVLARLQAERQTSWHQQFNGLFEDLHLVWAAAGATAGHGRDPLRGRGVDGAGAARAAAVDGGGDRRDGLARIRPQPGVGRRPHAAAALESGRAGGLGGDGPRRGGVRAGRGGDARGPRAEPGAAAPDTSALPVEEREILELLGAASQARFEPARAGGAPVAVNLVWLVAHTTVRGKGDDAWPVVHAAAAARRAAGPAAGAARQRTAAAAPDATAA